MQSGRKNGFLLGNKRIILGESGVVSRGLVRPCFDSTKLQILERPAVTFWDVLCVLGSLWLTEVFDDRYALGGGWKVEGNEKSTNALVASGSMS